VQYAVCLRDPNVADISTSQGFESDNDAQGTTNTPKTSALFSNVTLVGPQANSSVVANPNYRRAAHLRRNTELSFYNSVVMGWPGSGAQSGIYIDANSTADNATNNLLQIRNVILAGRDTVTTNVTNGFNPLAWFDTPSSGNTRLTTAAAVQLTDPFNLTNPNFTPQAGSPALSGADFTNPRLAGGFFTSTTFRGAFGNTRWDLGWTNYNPLATSSGSVSEVSGEITANTTWLRTRTYVLKGFVYVRSGATLTIESGTIVYGDKDSKGALIIEQGGKIMADGTADQPRLERRKHSLGRWLRETAEAAMSPADFSLLCPAATIIGTSNADKAAASATAEPDSADRMQAARIAT
jgi:hypothetical protein